MIFLQYSVAERVHLDVDEVRGWPEEKLIGWLAYFEAKAAKMKVK